MSSFPSYIKVDQKDCGSAIKLSLTKRSILTKKPELFKPKYY